MPHIAQNGEAIEVDYLGIARSDYASNVFALGQGGWRVDFSDSGRPYAVFQGTLEAAHASFQAILGRPLGEGEYLCAYGPNDVPLGDLGWDPTDADPIGREIGP